MAGRRCDETRRMSSLARCCVSRRLFSSTTRSTSSTRPARRVFRRARRSPTNILNNGYFIGETLRYSEKDRVCIPVPFYHCFGMVLGNLACTTHGASMVVPNEAFDPVLSMQTVQNERCTALYGVPTMFIAELEHPRFQEFDFSSLRTGIMAGSPCPVEVMKKVTTVMHMPEMTICYGMTET